MNFNIDDPLAGILSDGSDDSFFDDDILGKKKTPKKKAVLTPDKKNALFDLEPEKPKTVNSISDIKKDSFNNIEKSDSIKLEVTKSTSFKAVSPAPLKKELSKESVKIQPLDAKIRSAADIIKSPAKTKISASADPLDILGDYNEPKKNIGKTVEKGKSSQSLLDDILGGSSTKPTGSSQLTRPVTAARNQDFDFDSILGKNETKPKTAPQKSVTKIEKNVKDDKVQKKTKSSDDWLGIFNDKEDNDDVADMPAWLGGDMKKKKLVEHEKVLEPPIKESVKRDEIYEQKVEEQKDQKQRESASEPYIEKLFPPGPTTLRASNEDLTTEGAAMYLQQQESQLMVALQLKAQEEKLAAMQARQKDSQRLQREAALAHHEQLDAMVRQQANHRIQMQAVINAHQERITQRIRALLGTTHTEDNTNQGDEYGTTSLPEHAESPHVKEKKQLLQLVQSLQENHDKEIDLMETSYRRQLAFLEVSLNQAEERMKEESEKLTKFYSEKIIWLEEHHLLFKKLTEDNLSSLSDRHKAENEMLRQQHLDNIKVLQEHHAALMENIKNAVNQEQTLIQDSAGFSSDLRELVVDVKESKVKCQQLVDKVQALLESAQRDSDRSLQARETQIADMIHQLKIDRENFEKEKSENREMVNLLEKRLKQMTMMMEEEAVTVKQKKMEFEFEKATFSKQTEFAKNVLKKQDEEIKMLKEDIQKEYQEKVTKINEEKIKAEKDSAAIAKEKLSIQNLKQELEKLKAELHAQLEEVNEDRLKLNLEKQQMHMEEQRIMAKSRDLDFLAKAAVEKQLQSDKKYSEAEFIQNKYEERIRRLQEHVVSLNTREKQIAKEKVALSRERLTLHNERKKVENRQQCSLCKSTQFLPQYNYDSAFPDSFLNVSVSRDHGDTHVSSAMNAIANEMVGLKASKTFDLRRFAPSNIDDDRRLGEDNLQTMQTNDSTSGAFRDYMDPKFMMLRLDVQQVLSNLDQGKRDDDDTQKEH